MRKIHIFIFGFTVLMCFLYLSGGNCLTAMIATVSLEEENLSESISTCRFAQRVACITNQAKYVYFVNNHLLSVLFVL